jgi:hypothetical protein
MYCDDCLVAESGHADCELADCSVCYDVAVHVTKRSLVSRHFLSGSLMIDLSERW